MKNILHIDGKNFTFEKIFMFQSVDPDRQIIIFDKQFKKEYEDFGQIKQHTLSKWTKIYADLYYLDISERKSGLDRFIKFIRK